MSELTEAQKKVLNATKEFIKNNSYPPKRSELAKILNYKSSNAIEEHFNALRRKGFIKTLKGTARRIIIVDREV